MNILVTDRIKYYYHQITSHAWTFDWHIYIWPWPILKVKVKVMHISTMNSLEMVTDMIEITIAIQ